MGFYHTLMQETERERAQFLAIPLFAAAVEGKVSLQTYCAFLTQAYHHVSQTVPLLMAVGARLPERLEWLRGAVAEYIREEYGHHEWVLDDLRACGVDAEAVRCGEPAPETDRMIAYAWDTVLRRNPVGFFGMVLVLEGTSVTSPRARPRRSRRRSACRMRRSPTSPVTGISTRATSPTSNA